MRFPPASLGVASRKERLWDLRLAPGDLRPSLSLLQLWIPPAFGCRPEYDNGLEEIVFGFEPWIIAVNLAMPFSIFYRMHAAASLFEVYCKI